MKSISAECPSGREACAGQNSMCQFWRTEHWCVATVQYGKMIEFSLQECVQLRRRPFLWAPLAAEWQKRIMGTGTAGTFTKIKANCDRSKCFIFNSHIIQRTLKMEQLQGFLKALCNVFSLISAFWLYSYMAAFMVLMCYWKNTSILLLLLSLPFL